MWSAEVRSAFRRWLATARPATAVDPAATTRRWRGLTQDWRRSPDRDAFRARFLAELRDQRRDFVGAAASADPSAGGPRRLPDELPRSFFVVAEQVFRQLAARCAEESPPSVLFTTWEKAKDGGVPLTATTLNALLQVATRIAGSRREAEAEGPRVRALEEIVMFHDVVAGDSDAARDGARDEAAARTFRNTAKYASVLSDSRERSYLRAFRLMLAHRCRTGDAGAAVALLGRMRDLPGVVVEGADHVRVLAALAENGHLRWVSRSALPRASGPRCSLALLCG